MRFIVDSMLGDIARWLRMLGYDTLYSRNYEDWKILQLAEKDDRIIVTRDHGLFVRARKRGLRAVLLDPGDVKEALTEIAYRTGIELRFDPNKTLCPHCNVRLVRITRAEALSFLPAEVVSAYDRFWKCPKCGRIYWQGSHWRTINEILAQANELLERRRRVRRGVRKASGS